MKKFGFIHRLSVIPYLGFLISYRINIDWDLTEYRRLSYNLFHIFLWLSAAALIYQLIYIVFLRRKENVTLGFSVAPIFLYLFIGISGLIAASYIAIFAGYKYRSFGFGQLHKPEIYYGAEALDKFNESWLNPWVFIIFTAVFAVIYIIKRNKHKSTNLSKEQKNDRTDL